MANGKVNAASAAPVAVTVDGADVVPIINPVVMAELVASVGDPSVPTPVLDAIIGKPVDAPSPVAGKKPRKAAPAVAAPDEDADPVAAAMAHHNATVAAEEAAQVAITSQAAVIIADWVGRHRDDQSWMVKAGGALSAYLSAFIALHGIARRAEGVATVCQEVEELTGTDYSGDMSRCLLVYHAGLTFGMDAISALPVDAQRGFATLLVRTPVEGKDAETYTLPLPIANAARKLLAWTLCDRLAADTVPAHIAEQLPRATRAKSDGNKSRKPGVGWKGGLMCKGREVNLLCGKLNRYATAVAKGDTSVPNPWDAPVKAAATPAVTTPAVTTPAVTTPAVTADDKTPAVTTPAVTTPTGAVTTPAVTTPDGVTADDKTGTEPRRDQAAAQPGVPVILTADVSPIQIAKSIIGSLQSADDMGAVLAAMGASVDFTAVHMAGLIAGMVAGKRAELLVEIAKMCGKAGNQIKAGVVPTVAAPKKSK